MDPDDWLPEGNETLDEGPVIENKTIDLSQEVPTSVQTSEIIKDDLALESNAVPSEPVELDTDALEILGDDPTSEIKFGNEIRTELSSRLQHIVQEGLTKEVRKNLISKYPLPSNCTYIGAPKINLEIKAALADASIKRDKGIEAKQRQMSSAISCLSEVINAQLNLKERDNDLLQKLMDTTRILCDIQHSDSGTRKFFILSSLKREMKEHLTNTKIDSFLFGENLAETIKSAKAVNKSGVELKADIANKNQPKQSNMPHPRPLNRKPPASARRPPTAPVRSRGPAAQRPPPPPQPYAHSSRTSWLPPPPPPPPPPPLPPTARRRY